ncbi:MAG: beta-ketoacyl-ACP synthase III [Actinomycetota bacterium]
MTYAAITGWGMFVPSRIVTNGDLAREVPGVDEEWIVRRSGIRERRVADPSQTTASLATEAARRALAGAGRSPADVDLVVVATCTPDRLIPGAAPLVQAALGATGAGAFDVNAACAGFLTALAVADAMVRAGTVRCAVVVGAEVLSRFVDRSDPKTSVLFADGSGAVVLERTDEPAGLISLELGADGSGASLIEIPAGGSARPATAETVAAGEHTLRMNGPEVYRAAVRVMAGAAERAAFGAGMRVTDADLLILHQANQRIIDEVGERLGLSSDRVFSNVARYGNTSAASVPIALCEAADAGRLAPGARLVVSVVGAGLTWAAGVVLWTGALPSRSTELVGVVRGES